ncbi:MAG TPA: sulfotransferase [Patescibacteria group bacterium]|nr:sulfotransferase [Patescibacteria group bacterium]
MQEDTKKPQLDFVGIGFTKCGSTWIYKLLEEHPEICMSKTKETNFFANYDLVAEPRKLKYFEEFFPRDCGDRIKGEFSPMYIARDIALKNLVEHYPKVKFLVILRNPVEKRISEVMYNYRLKSDVEKLDLDRVIQERFRDKPEQKTYSPRLAEWLQAFPSENFHIMILEEFARDPYNKISELYDFLGVDNSFRPQVAEQKANTAHGFRHPKLQKRLRNAHKRVKRHPRLAKALKSVSRPLKLKQRIMAWNKKQFRRPQVSTETKRILLDLHRKDIEELEKLLNKDLSIWKNSL